MSVGHLVRPENFMKVFLAQVIQKEAQLLELWNQWQAFTELMLRLNEGVFGEIAKELDLKYYREYWTIDAVYFEDRHREYDALKSGTYAKYLSIAVEHENKCHEAHEEVNKLSILNCPLKVLVTYPYPHDANNKLLEDYADIARSADIFGDFDEKRKQLVVFGYLKEGKPRWEFHIYREGRFIQIEPVN